MNFLNNVGNIKIEVGEYAKVENALNSKYFIIFNLPTQFSLDSEQFWADQKVHTVFAGFANRS